MEQHIFYYLVIINALAIAITILDKALARLHTIRIPERLLFVVAILGGSIGMYVTMKLIRHKTRKAKFMWGIPIILAIELFSAWFFKLF